MRAVVQRVIQAGVTSAGQVVGEIGKGLLIYLGIQKDDTDDDARYIADKIRHLRVFPDEKKPLNRDVADAGGAVLVVSAFTTAGDARKGRRPSFDNAADGPCAEPLYERVCDQLAALGLTVRRGRFGANMGVRSDNDGPVCILLDSKRVF